ncbi:MAG: LysR family transcriptional regulator [Pseudomonadota bacterium]
MTYRLPSLNSLRAFEAAARHLSFRAAASEIGVTSGAISQQVRKLERSLGVDLFRRLPHGLLLTAEGAAYLPRITRVFDDLTAATEEIAPEMNGRKFSVGVCPRAAAVLPPGWPLARRNLEPHVRERVATADLHEVKAGAIDCLVRLGGGDGDLERFEIARVADASGREERLCLICKPGLAHCLQNAALIADLRGLLSPKTAGEIVDVRAEIG